MTQFRTGKILMIRLSSLGDVILATSALSGLQKRAEFAQRYRPQVHWVVSKEYASLLKGHPGLDKLWEFDRKSGIQGWVNLCEQLWKEDFSEVYDLHSTLRSHLARGYFFMRRAVASLGASAERKEQLSAQIWRVIDKQRLKLYGYFFLKKLFPPSLRPTPFVARYASLVGGTGEERPDLKYLAVNSGATLPDDFQRFGQNPYLCVMPSSRWDGKKWPVRNFFEVIRKSGLPVVILGGKQERESILLAKMLEQAGISSYSGVGVFNFAQLAIVLAHSLGYLGNDTGLGHLAEAVGSRAFVLFGPTAPDMGFGPWSSASRIVSSSLWCSPCGKDGRYCFRLDNRFACQKRILPEAVLSILPKE
jgi:ADP-heptose:LPS heptosyltransferase